MVEWFLAGACLLLALIIWARGRSTGVQLEEYKELFNTSEKDNKELTDKVEGFLRSINEKDLQLERSTSAGEHLAERLAEKGESINSQEGTIEGLRTTLEYEQQQYAKLIGQKKSSEVRTGKIAEQISPFLHDYPAPSNTARFIGDPIDFVHFEPDKVIFVEVKSGKSQLSKKQRLIRDLIRDGKVEFLVYRVEGKDDGEN